VATTATERQPWTGSLAPSPTVARAALSEDPPAVYLSPAAAIWQDRRWAIALTLLVLALTLIPPTAARLFGPADRVHVGTYWYHEDFTVYLAAMREAATTPSWLIHDHFAIEPHGPIMMFPLYVLIGKASAVLGLPLLAVYAAVELTSRVALALTIYAFVATLVANRARQRLGFVLAVFGAGLGFWTAVVHALSAAPGEASARLVNLFVEAMTFGVFLSAPHISLGLASILGGLLAFAAASRGSKTGLAALAISVLVLGLVHPFSAPVLLGTVGIYVVVRTVVERRVPWLAVRAAALAGVIGVPFVLYNYIAFTFTPVWSEAFGVQNRLPSPRPWELLLDYGVVLALAPLGILAVRGRTTIEQRVVLTFLAVIAVCIYLPVPYQRRFAFGAQPALAAFAALGWPLAVSGLARLLAALQKSDTLNLALARRVLLYGLVPLGFTTAVTAYFVVLTSAISNEPLPMYVVDRDTYAVGQWIADHSGPDDVTLGSSETGSVFGSLVPGKVYAGHSGVTIHAAEKKEQIAALYGGQLDRGEVRDFLATNRVDFVVFGSEERKLGSWDPGVELELAVADREGSAVVYRTTVGR
jgi:hypothetical protein